LNERLDKTDARFVDVIHCNTKLLGTDVQAGHADFYPNSGYTQPGCNWDVSGTFSEYFYVLHFLLTVSVINNEGYLQCFKL